MFGVGPIRAAYNRLGHADAISTPTGVSRLDKTLWDLVGQGSGYVGMATTFVGAATALEAPLTLVMSKL